MSYILPIYPITLSILNVENQLRTVTLKHAGIKDAGDTARKMSETHPWFIVILDAENQRHGAFLKGQYIDSTVTEDDMAEMAEHWQEEMKAPKGN
jgi:hypothetical protein